MNVPPPVNNPTPESGSSVKKTKNAVLLWTIAGLGAFCFLLYLGLVIYTGLGYAKIPAKRTQALIELKQLSAAVLLYVSDNNDRFPNPMTPDTVLGTLDQSREFTYVKNSGLTTNSELAGTLITSIEDPSTTWMMRFESKKIGDISIIAFADGSGKFQPVSE